MLNLLDPDTKPTLLVVDDTPENLSLLSALLGPHYRIKVAISGQRALEILSSGTRVDLILLDVVMPQMDGYQVLQAIRKTGKNGQDVPILAMTAHAGPGDERRCLEAGMDAYISKPIDGAALLNLLNRLLATKRTEPAR